MIQAELEYKTRRKTGDVTRLFITQSAGYVTGSN